MADATLPHFMASAEISSLTFASLRQTLIEEAAEHDLPIVTDTGDAVRCRTAFGDVSAFATGEGVRLEISAPSESFLSELKDAIIVHLAEAVPQLMRGLQWSDAAPAGSLPKNFRFATVVDLQPLGPLFLRVTLQSHDLDDYTSQSIHFRLALPPAGLADVTWPSLDADGQTIWPQGENALHRPVYTARSCDAAAGLLVFDVYLHDGGRVTEWLRTRPLGVTIGMTGPGGSGQLDEELVYMFADETGFPAMARILENLSPHAKGEAYFESENGIPSDYPVIAPDGIVLHWLKRGDGLPIADLAVQRMAEEEGGFLWVAAEKGGVTRLRQALASQLKTRGTRKYVSAYWQR
ncbi:siderophore-interacting protein [Rhizobium sp. FY34]|uniref:siderophore-interacting protein n=1 Tax=Rhizobium sp. FY34 TaxID=2562309 RepID=UPI0010BF8E76|nr:siderophore-interacting protein [Rhizobium sp. FY34]